MKNKRLQQLDRQLRLRGETVQLVRQSGGSRVRINVKGLIQTFGTQQLVGSITQVNYIVVVSPTELRRKGWPGGVPATIPAGVGIPTIDPVIPSKSLIDNVAFRGKTTAVMNVDAIYDNEELVRLELRVLG